jgi:hypothetical protein
MAEGAYRERLPAQRPTDETGQHRGADQVVGDRAPRLGVGVAGGEVQAVLHVQREVADAERAVREHAGAVVRPQVLEPVHRVTGAEPAEADDRVHAEQQQRLLVEHQPGKGPGDGPDQ